MAVLYGGRPVRARTEALRKHLAKAREEVAGIVADSRLSVEGKAAKLAPIREGFAAGVAKLRAENASDVAASLAALSAHFPKRKQREAAMKQPERATSLRQLAATLPFEELAQMAKEAQRDHVLAYALTDIDAVRTEKLKPEQRAALAEALAFVPTGASRTALADLVVARVEAARFDQLAAEGVDGAPVSPEHKLEALYTALTVETEADTLSITEDELAEFYDIVELPRAFVDDGAPLRVPDTAEGRMLAAFAGASA